MKLTVNEIKKNATETPFTFDKMLDVPEIKKMNDEIRDIKPVRVKGNCVVDGDEYIFSLNISGEMVLPCARTLVDVHYPFDINEVEVFSETPYYGEEEEEEEIYPVQGEVIDLTPCILENILLAVPFRVFSDDPEVLDNALVKGDGWELTLEEEEAARKDKEKSIDPRLMKLKTFLNDHENEK